MSSSIHQSGYLQDTAPARAASIRPPWSLPEPLFMALCTGCGDCRDECPRGLLQKSAAGFPVVDFSQGDCHFCGECVEACAYGALTRSYRGADWGPWGLKARISDACLCGQGIICRQCLQRCTAHAIRLGRANGDFRPVIDAQLCNGCGACYNGCPTRAVSFSADPAS